MRYINYTSDFEFHQQLDTTAPFELTYYIQGKEQRLVASYDGRKYTNCISDGDGIIVSVDHSSVQLGIGRIRCTARYYLNNEHYKDGIYEPVSDFEIGIELHRGKSDDMGDLVATPLPSYHIVYSEGGGSGITIVSSIDELDLDAPQGSLASVAVNEPDIARPIEECYIKATENPYLIKSLEYKESTEEWSFDAVFGAYGLYNNSVIPVEQMLNIYGDINNLNVWFSDNGDDTLITGGELNTELLNKTCEFISSLGGVVLYGAYADSNDTHVKVTDMDEHALWSLNQVFNFICGTQETTLYIKDVEGWKVVSDKELKAKVVNLQAAVNSLEDTVNSLEDKTDLIVNSIDELPQDAPLGSLASVITKENKTELVPVSEVFVAGGAAYGLTIVIPEKVDPTDFNAESRLELNFSTNQTNRGAISVGSFSGKKGIFGSDGSRMPSMLAEYDSDGNLQNVNQSLIDTLLGTVTTYRGILGGDILDKYFFVPKNTISYKTVIHTKNETGWEQYSALVDQSVTTEKVADGAITSAKIAAGVIPTKTSELTNDSGYVTDTKIVNQTEEAVEIQPNTLNVWGEVASLDITLAEPTDNSVVNEYMVQFVSGVTATTLTLPNTIKWMAAPNIQPNKTYQLSIINNLGVIGEFSHE